MTIESRIPGEARELARRLGVNAESRGDRVLFRQTGRLRRDASSGWMGFRARQTIWTDECAFDWRAWTGPGGLVSVRDALLGGKGRLRVKALGFLPIARAEGSPEVTRGELMRYLAELPWAPQAILRNRNLRWRREGPDRLVVGAGEAECSADIVLALDEHGRIASTFAPDRPRAVGREFVPTPWHGRFLDYGRHDGLWLPSRAEVAWVIDGVETPCFEGRVEEWRMAV